MVLFLNFAPFTFGGGAERWMLDVASASNKQEKVTLVDVHRSIANVYGRFVLKREFHKRITIESDITHTSLSFRSFLPFRSEWRQARVTFQNARRIYIRYELLELIIVLYLGGATALKKTIAGIHSPFIYQSPVTFFDYLHNFVYGSFTSRIFLSFMIKIHVINPKDYGLFTEKLDLKNVVYVPNFITIPNNSTDEKTIQNKFLNIIFVGELNKRKGVDILIETIKQSPNTLNYYISGDGVMKKDIEKLKTIQNVTYVGYLDKNQLNELFKKCDVLFLPSRAESFSLVCLEAMSYGLPIISSTDTEIGLPAWVQQINKTKTIHEYLTIFENMLNKKLQGKLDKQKKEIQDYTRKNFSREIILPQLLHKIVDVKN